MTTNFKFKLSIVTGNILRKKNIDMEFQAEDVVGARAYALSSMREAGEDDKVLRALLTFGNGVPVGHIYPPNATYDCYQWRGVSSSSKWAIKDDGSLGVRLCNEG